MNNKKNIDDYFDDNFEVTYTGDLPSIPVGQDDYDDTDYLNDYETDDYYDETDRLAPDYDDDYEEEDSYYDRQRPARQTERRNSRRRPDSSSEELAAPIRNIARTGSTAAEKLTTFILRPAPVLMSAVILAITFFSFWNQMSNYGDIKTLSSTPDLTLVAYLAVGGVMLIWMLSTFFFTLSGIRHGTGRGLTYLFCSGIYSFLPVQPCGKCNSCGCRTVYRYPGRHPGIWFSLPGIFSILRGGNYYLYFAENFEVKHSSY